MFVFLCAAGFIFIGLSKKHSLTNVTGKSWIKNVLTNEKIYSKLIKVVETTDRKVGIRLTMARVSDPGS